MRYDIEPDIKTFLIFVLPGSADLCPDITLLLKSGALLRLWADGFLYLLQSLQMIPRS